MTDHREPPTIPIGWNRLRRRHRTPRRRSDNYFSWATFFLGMTVGWLLGVWLMVAAFWLLN